MALRLHELFRGRKRYEARLKRKRQRLERRIWFERLESRIVLNGRRDLTGIASRLTLNEIYEALLFPSRTIAPPYRLKELSLPRGRKARGFFRNETSESIELFDLKSRQWTPYVKADVLFYRTIRTSHMPDGLLESLGESERGDLLAFLSGLK